MVNYKEKIKVIILIIIILGIIVYSFINIKNNKNEFIYSDLDLNEKANEDDSYIEIDNTEVKEKIKVYVTGEVNNPKVIELDKGARIEDAIREAGGITNKANLKEVNLAYVLSDGQKVKIPNIDNDLEIEYISEENGEGIIEDTNIGYKKINLNTANINDLKTIPGVGESMAQKIIDYRLENGKFKKIEDLKNISRDRR